MRISDWSSDVCSSDLVLRAQKDLGIDVPDGVIEDYQRVVDGGEESVDLASIAARERVTRHDVKARIEEFCALAGHEHIHKGMTSRDLTENVEQLQVLQSLTRSEEHTSELQSLMRTSYAVFCLKKKKKNKKHHN